MSFQFSEKLLKPVTFLQCDYLQEIEFWLFANFFVECKVLIESYMSGRAVVPVLKMYFQDFFVWAMLHWQRQHWFFVIVKIERKLIDQGTKQTASLPTPKFTFNLKGCFFRKTYFGKFARSKTTSRGWMIGKRTQPFHKSCQK